MNLSVVAHTASWSYKRKDRLSLQIRLHKAITEAGGVRNMTQQRWACMSWVDLPYQGDGVFYRIAGLYYLMLAPEFAVYGDEPDTVTGVTVARWLPHNREIASYAERFAVFVEMLGVPDWRQYHHRLDRTERFPLIQAASDFLRLRWLRSPLKMEEFQLIFHYGRHVVGV